MNIPLSPDLEYLVLNSIMRGEMTPLAVRGEELSKLGRHILTAIQHLSLRQAPPFSPQAVVVTAADIYGADRDEVKAYLQHVTAAEPAPTTAHLLDALRARRCLIDVVNLAAEQLNSGQVDLSALATTLHKHERTAQLAPLAQQIGETLPALPSGPAIAGLPRLSTASGGVFGFWVIGGEPGVGKSTLALQIAVSLQKSLPVLFYDMEQGQAAVLSHLAEVFNRDPARVRAATARLYLRSSLRSLDTDLQYIKPPALLVIDSLQKVPVRLEHRRAGLDSWVHRFEALKQEGYSILAISEVQRAVYSEFRRSPDGAMARMGGYKESGEIEYAADFAAQLGAVEGFHDRVQVHVVKNRHRPQKGVVTELERVRGWWFREVELTGVSAFETWEAVRETGE